MKLSIVIPAYNEENRIGNTLENYINFFNKSKLNYEILVVLNGCTDNTIGIIKKFRNKSLKYKNIKEPIGKGGAIIEGIKLAQGDLISYIDADGAIQPRELFDLAKKIKNYDGIIASRHLPESKILKKEPFDRRIGSRGWNILVRLILNLNFKDTQCGGKVFKKNAIKSIVNNIITKKWAFDVNVLYLLKKKRYRIKETPTIWQHDPMSTFKMYKVAPEMFISLLKIRFS